MNQKQLAAQKLAITRAIAEKKGKHSSGKRDPELSAIV
jgi:hypothetical protein